MTKFSDLTTFKKRDLIDEAAYYESKHKRDVKAKIKAETDKEEPTDNLDPRDWSGKNWNWFYKFMDGED